MDFKQAFIEGFKTTSGQQELANYHNNFNQFMSTYRLPNKHGQDDSSEMEAYSSGNVSWVNIALNRKITDISNIEYFFVDKEGKQVEWDKVPEEYRIALDNGFDDYSLSDLISFAGAHEDLSGNALWVLDDQVNVYSKKNKIPYQLMPITPGNFKINISSKGRYIESYTVKYKDGSEKDYNPDEVVHFKRNALITPFIGIGLIAQGRSLVDFESVAIDYQTTFLEKDGTPDLVYIDKNMANPDQAKSKAKQLRTEYSAGKYAQSLLYAYGDVDIKGFSLSSNDLQFIENRQMNKNQIISLMESTPIVLGDESGAGNYAIANKATNNYFGIVNSRTKHLINAINKQFVWKIKGNEEKKYSLSFNPYPVGDVEELKKSVESGLLSPANASKQLGYEYDEKDEASNALYISRGVQSLQTTFETEPLNFNLSDDLSDIKKKRVILDYQ